MSLSGLYVDSFELASGFHWPGQLVSQLRVTDTCTEPPGWQADNQASPVAAIGDVLMPWASLEAYELDLLNVCPLVVARVESCACVWLTAAIGMPNVKSRKVGQSMLTD